jgi:hypothetical protein
MKTLEAGLVALLALGLGLEGAPGGLSAVPSSGPTVEVSSTGQALAQARRRKPPAGRGTTKKPPVRPEPEPASAPEPAPASGGGGEVPIGMAGTTKVEFDGLQIKGQTTKAGEVQILQRKETGLRSMVKRRTSFREEIIQTVFPEQSHHL